MPVLDLPPLQPAEAYPKWQFFGVSFGGVDWDYRIVWNDREGVEAWYLYLQRSDKSTPPINGVKLVPLWTLAERYTGRGPSGGTLMLIDRGENARDRPTYEGLGHRWILVWVDDEELADTSSERTYTIGPVTDGTP